MTQIKSRDFMRAIFKGNIDTIKDLIVQGLDVYELTEKEQWNYLHRATVSVSLKTNIDSLKLLISQGIDVNAKDCYGNTPLQYAARVKNIEVIDLLIDSGSDVNTLNNDKITPLQHAFQSKPYTYEAIELLLQKGADPNHPLPSGKSSIREYVAAICHGENASINNLFESFK